MKRGLLVLLAALMVGVGGSLLARHLLEGSPTSWLGHHYALSTEKVSCIESLHKEYCSRCRPYCGKMCEANARLEQIALNDGLGRGNVTPELRSAVAETDQIRTEMRIAMLEHFYAVAAELPSEKRKEYLLKVLPLVIDSCGPR